MRRKASDQAGQGYLPCASKLTLQSWINTTNLFLSHLCKSVLVTQKGRGSSAPHSPSEVQAGGRCAALWHQHYSRWLRGLPGQEGGCGALMFSSRLEVMHFTSTQRPLARTSHWPLLTAGARDLPEGPGRKQKLDLVSTSNSFFDEGMEILALGIHRK